MCFECYKALWVKHGPGQTLRDSPVHLEAAAVAPQVPCTGIFLGPSKSGKTIALISAILEQYRTADGSSVFERIFIFSPSIEIDDGWKPVKEFIENEMGVNTEREQVYFDKWDEGALRTIIEQHKKITRTSKQLGLKKLYQALVVIDDFADQPELHRRTGDGALGTLFIRGRHMQITWRTPWCLLNVGSSQLVSVISFLHLSLINDG